MLQEVVWGLQEMEILVVQVMRADMVLVEEEMLVELVVEQQETQMLGVQVKVEMKVGKEGVLEE